MGKYEIKFSNTIEYPWTECECISIGYVPKTIGTCILSKCELDASASFRLTIRNVNTFKLIRLTSSAIQVLD